MKIYIIITIVVIIFILALVLGWRWGKVFLAKDYDTMLESLYNNTVPLIKPKAIANIQDYIVLDTRAKREWEVSHLPNAIWVDYPTANLSCLDSQSKDKAILLYCSVGYRSEKIGEQLQKLGFKNVHNLYGGIFEWVNKNRTVVDAQNDTITSVHGYTPNWGKWVANNKIKKIYE